MRAFGGGVGVGLTLPDDAGDGVTAGIEKGVAVGCGDGDAGVPIGGGVGGGVAATAAKRVGEPAKKVAATAIVAAADAKREEGLTGCGFGGGGGGSF